MVVEMCQHTEVWIAYRLAGVQRIDFEVLSLS